MLKISKAEALQERNKLFKEMTTVLRPPFMDDALAERVEESRKKKLLAMSKRKRLRLTRQDEEALQLLKSKRYRLNSGQLFIWSGRQKRKAPLSTGFCLPAPSVKPMLGDCRDPQCSS